MPRKVLEYIVPAIDGVENRDAGKTFVITEMGALQAEKWAIRVFLALARSGAEIPADAVRNGFAGLVPYLSALVGGVRWEDAEPLLAEMLRCVTVKRADPAGTAAVYPLHDDDIEELETLTVLRAEVVKLHAGFWKAASRLILGTAASKTSSEPKPSPTAPTSLKL